MKQHPSITTDVLSFVDPRVEHALRLATQSMASNGIRHVICGGLAVGAYGHVRATKDVDFMVGDEAFVGTGVVMLAAGVPHNVGGIPTDAVSIPPDAPFLEHELDDPYDFDGMPIISPEGLVVMKLVAFRRKDKLDIIEVVNAGATSFEAVEEYLETWSEGAQQEYLLMRLHALAEEAGAE